MDFIAGQFKQQVERPYKQLGKVIELWRELVPDTLADHTKLESLARGTLRVAVDSSARLYELDGLLRQGLKQQLISRFTGGSIRRIQLRLTDAGPPD